ncbi:MAG: PHP domain-containing protein [Clostridia bacterium]|jgi:predicted metal-dependent phosphoesterase TrpH|nr:PHP domain-containing protein [Clostridia bacterium]MDH7573155.1 PHP domain-containing protein [Clostridia bacterium]
MRWYAADLHLHTALSPCAAEDMTPLKILAAARRAGLDLIAVTDHNSAGNVAAVQEASFREGGPAVLAGMEVQTREEVHVVCLFGGVEEALALERVVFAHLPPLGNREDLFGPQILLSGRDEEIGREERLLLQSTDLALEEVVERVERLGGVAIPAHVDRPAYGLLGVLGVLPPRLAVPALEISRPERRDEVRRALGGSDITLICSSDAHYLSDIGRCRTRFFLKEPALAEVRLALAGEGGRRAVIDG